MHKNAKSVEYQQVVEQDGKMIMLKKDSGIEFFPQEFKIYICCKSCVFYSLKSVKLGFSVVLQRMN